MADEIRSEIPNERAKWGGPKNWESMVRSLKKYVDGRARFLINDLRKAIRISDEEMETYFGKLPH